MIRSKKTLFNYIFSRIRLYVKSGPSLTGFTLIELLIVIAILIILAGIVAPRLNMSFLNQKLDVDSKKLASNLGLARQYAIGQKDLRRYYGVVFYGNGYRIVPYSDPNTPLSSVVVSSSMNANGDIPFSNGINVSSSQNIIFDFRGGTLSPGDAQIVLTNGSSTRTIIVSRVIGYVTIQ